LAEFQGIKLVFTADKVDVIVANYSILQDVYYPEIIVEKHLMAR